MKLTRRGKYTIVFILLLVILILIFRLLPKDYEINYKVNDFTIVEKYLKKDKMYVFNISKNKQKYETISTKKYSTKRKLVNKIKSYDEDNISCVVIDSEKIDNNILCIKDGKNIDYNLTNILPKKYYKKYKKNEKEYENISINFIDDKTYLVWDYTGYYKLNKNKTEKVKLFKSDIYNPQLSTIMDKYIIIADYNQKYNFNKLLKVNIESKKIDIIDLKYDIAFDSNIIGVYKNNIYILDEKNKKEYEINIKREECNRINKDGYGKILENGTWKKYKINKIITDHIIFKDNKYNDYKIKNNLYLYQKNIKKPILISDKEIKNIVYKDEQEVYYIVDQKLYKYNFEYGENKVLDYFELNFNYDNMILIYDK